MNASNLLLTRENRLGSRFPISALVSIKIGDRFVLVGTVKNLSTRGLCIHVAETFVYPKDAPRVDTSNLEIEISPLGNSSLGVIRAFGRSTWASSRSNTSGIELREFEGRGREKVEAYLRECASTRFGHSI